MAYFTYTTLKDLTQDDLFSIMLYGGGITLFMFTGLVAILIWEFKQAGRDLNAPIATTLLKSMGSGIVLSILFLIGVVMFMVVYLGVFGDSTALNPAQAMDWFLHTQWTNLSLALGEHLDKIEPYGEDALAQARNTIGIIYTMYLVFIFLFIAMNITILAYATSKAGKMLNAQRDNINQAEYVGVIIMSIMGAIIYLGLNMKFFNSAVDEIFTISNKLTDGRTITNETHIERLYGEMFNFKLASGSASVEDYDLEDDNQEDINEIL